MLSKCLHDEVSSNVKNGLFMVLGEGRYELHFMQSNVFF